MITSNVVSLICAIATLVATIVIGFLQIWQNRKMKDFEQRQDDRDEKRHEEDVNSKAVSFISNYYEVRGLIPLCAIASMYNKLFYYKRDMYREFCCYTPEVQNRILEYCELDLRVVETESNELYIRCLEALETTIKDSFPSEQRSIYYDGGKYLLRSLTSYGPTFLPHKDYSYDNHIADVICDASKEMSNDVSPINQLAIDYSFDVSKEIEACQLATTIAIYVAMYCSKRNNDGKDYGSPGEYDGETIDSMEDLFLRALFEIYTNLVL